MPGPLVALLLLVSLPLQALAQPLGVVECRALRERRRQLATQAMQAEIALVLATRRRLCPRLEALAEQANAGTVAAGARSAEVGPAAQASAPSPARPQAAPVEAAAAEFDYTAYLDCRQQAEQQLRRSRTVLYTNQNGFTFYTADGARLARQADAWQQRLSASCEAQDRPGATGRR